MLTERLSNLLDFTHYLDDYDELSDPNFDL